VVSNDLFCLGDLARRETNGCYDFNIGADPEFGFTIRVRNVHVHSRFFPGEKEQAIRTDAQDGR